MLPFQSPFPNQNQVRGGNNPSLNQLPSSSSARPNQLGFHNPPMMMPPIAGFHNQNALLGSLLAQQQLIQGLQNNLMAVLSQQGVMPQFQGQQVNLLCGLPNPNLMPVQQGGLLGPPPLNQNPNQMTRFSPNGFLCSQNSNIAPNSQLPIMSAGIPNPAFLANGNHQIQPSITNSTSLETQIATQNLQQPILSCSLQNNQCRPGIPNTAFLANGNHQIRPSITNSTGLESQIVAQNLQQPILPCSLQNNQCNGQLWPQMNLSQAGGINFSTNFSENVASNNFKTKFNGPGKRESSNMSQGNAWKKMGPFPRVDRRGQQQRNERNIQYSENNINTSNIRKRPLAVIYDESEVRQWREARKRNFPTREKKLNPNSERKEDMDSDAKARRQEIKEILTKQAELGVPVAEIPPKYLFEPKAQSSGNIDAHQARNDTRYSKFNNKRGRFRRDNRNAKRQKFNGGESHPYAPVVRKRDPTLLRKLLNADIRRDKSQLLQAFRFMVLNSFFKSSPGEPLVFPTITAKDAAAPETGVVVADDLLENDVKCAAASVGGNGDGEAIESDSDEIDGASDVVCEAVVKDFTADGEKSEEGEITD